MTAPIRSAEIERAVRSVLRGGAQVSRVVIDVHQGQIIIETQPVPKAEPSFDDLDFRREAG
jgi:hypothetical protein